MFSSQYQRHNIVPGELELDYLATNKAAWDMRTNTHIVSEFYNVNGFLDGNTSLNEIELTELPDVEGKTLLHLQCHFGLDTLSWARKGAIVTGVDFSPVAIEQANQIKVASKLKAQFICSDVYAFGSRVNTNYDIVFTSYGALCWLPCITKWAETVATCLKPGGRFYIVEFHPTYYLTAGYCYFHSSEPDVEEEGTYTENGSDNISKIATWAHTLSDVANALINVGIQIDRINEFPFSPCNCFDGLEERQAGRYYVANTKHEIPLVYSILGTKFA